jgi:DNA polymerase delta subunit 3
MASHSRPASSKGCESDEDEDVEMTDADLPPKPKRRKREKKVVPVGRNGLAKRRVIKTRKKLDSQGYKGDLCCTAFSNRKFMVFSVTEDYSSYESVDEETVVEKEVPKKTKKKSSAENDGEPSTALPPKKKSEGIKRKGTGSSKSAGSFSKLGPGGSITNFFGPAKNK